LDKKVFFSTEKKFILKKNDLDNILGEKKISYMNSDTGVQRPANIYNFKKNESF